MATTTDDMMLEPSVDPKTKKIGVRNVTGRNDAGTRTVINVRHFPEMITDEPDSMGGTNTAPSPLETTIAALVGCDGVIINGVASAMGFDYTGVDFDCSSQIDVRGPKGVPGIKPYFEKVDLKITVYSDESDERFEKLKFNVENRCPVMNLMKDAGVELNADWIKQPAEK